MRGMLILEMRGAIASVPSMFSFLSISIIVEDKGKHVQYGFGVICIRVFRYFVSTTKKGKRKTLEQDDVFPYAEFDLPTLWGYI